MKKWASIILLCNFIINHTHFQKILQIEKKSDKFSKKNNFMFSKNVEVQKLQKFLSPEISKP